MIRIVGSKSHRMLSRRSEPKMSFSKAVFHDLLMDTGRSQLSSKQLVNQRHKKILRCSSDLRQLSSTPGRFLATASNAKAHQRQPGKHDSQHDLVLDVFRIPDPPKKRNPRAYKAVAFESYRQIMERVVDDVENPKFRKWRQGKAGISEEIARPAIEYLLHNERMLDTDNLQTLHEVVQDGNVDTTKRSSLIEELKRQANAFKEKCKLTQVQYQLIEGALTKAAATCASEADGSPVDIIWAKMKEGGFVRRPLVQNLLYVATTFSTGTNRRRGPFAHLTRSVVFDIIDSEHDDSNNQEGLDTADELAILQDMIYEPTDRSLSLRVRLMVERGHAEQAEELLELSKGETELHLRSYVPILHLYLELNNVNGALRLFQRMQSSATVHLDVDTYITVLSELARRGHFKPHDNDNLKEDRGIQLWNSLVTKMSDDVLEISMASAKRLFNAFADGFPESGLVRSSSMAPLQASDKRASDNELVVSHVRIDPSTGKCDRTGISLRLIRLEEVETLRLKEDIIKIAEGSPSLTNESQAKKGVDKRNKTNRLQPSEGLQQFANWLDTRLGSPFTVFIDGPNIGYYMQNFHEGRFNFHQIKSVVEALEDMGENPLVILPSRYSMDKFPMSLGGGNPGEPSLSGLQTLSRNEKAIRSDLLQRERLYIVPPGHHDDYYTIMASVSQQSAARNGQDLQVLPGNTAGRWPGARPLVVSNDRFRDHRLALIDERVFRRWFSNCVVTYDFAGFVGKSRLRARISFSPADVFSREIQGNKDASGNMVWHFPTEEHADDWFCVRIPNSESN